MQSISSILKDIQNTSSKAEKNSKKTFVIGLAACICIVLSVLFGILTMIGRVADIDALFEFGISFAISFGVAGSITFILALTTFDEI